MTEAGCMATDSINVVVMPDSRIDIPNAFAPGRGPNGKLKVLHLGDATLKTFAVYNRWGTKVFETSDINEGWDGTYQNEPQPMGVYIYSIEAKSAKGVPFSKNGNTTLIR
jgi:gliding motility-associated-like protein